MSTFIIRNKETLEQWVASSGKRSWNKSNHAKAAFANSSGKTKRDPLLKEFVGNLARYESLKFNDQNVYEVVELYSDAEKVAARNTKVLKEIEKKLAELKESLRYMELRQPDSFELCRKIDSIKGLITCEDKRG